MQKYSVLPSNRLALAVTLATLFLLACSVGGRATRSGDGVTSNNPLPTETSTPRPTFTAAAANTAEPVAAVVSSPVPRQQNSPAEAAPAFTPTPPAAAGQPAQATENVVEAAPSPAPAQPANPVATPTAASAPGVEPTPVPLQPAPTQPAAPPPPPSPPPAPGQPTPTVVIRDWSFVGIQSSLDEDRAFVVGELINTTGAPQKEVVMTGTFYDEQDRVIIDEIDTLSYVPIDVIPVGGRVPFELAIETSQAIYRFDLFAISEEADVSPRQDFEFLDLRQWTDEAGMYCVSGQIKNPGPPLKEYLLALTVVYDNQNRVVTFGEYSAASPAKIAGEKTAPFETCIDPLDRTTARYELRAVGQ